MKHGSTSRDRELEAGSSAHYEDPAYYTQAYKDRLEDIRYYVDRATANGGPILEYGCGNGRITLPIARAGVRVMGVDLCAPMLDDLRRRLAAEPEHIRQLVRVKHGDMRTLRLRERFALVVCPFNTFLHLYTRQDVEAFLARAREHLAPGGELVIDLSIPQPHELVRDPARAYGTPRFLYPRAERRPGKRRRGQLVKYTERFDYDKVRQILFVAMEFTPADGGEPWMTPLAHRMFHPLELEALLHYNGFDIVAQNDGFEGAPLAPDATHLVVRCRARRRPRAPRGGPSAPPDPRST